MTTVELLNRRWRIEQCKARDCDADIVFARTHSGSRMPVDATPSPGGEWRLDDLGYIEPVAVYAAKNPEVLAASQAGTPIPLHTSHFATCPAAKRFRRPR